MLSYTFKNSHSQVNDPGHEGPIAWKLRVCLEEGFFFVTKLNI